MKGVRLPTLQGGGRSPPPPFFLPTPMLFGDPEPPGSILVCLLRISGPLDFAYYAFRVSSVKVSRIQISLYRPIHVYTQVQ